MSGALGLLPKGEYEDTLTAPEVREADAVESAADMVAPGKFSKYPVGVVSGVNGFVPNGA